MSRQGPVPIPEPERGVELMGEPHVCEGCGCIGNEKMKPLDNRHAEGCPSRQRGAPNMVRPLLVDQLTVIDRDTGYPNEYAKRVKARNASDYAYLQLHALHGHAVAAEAVCEQFGHDARAGRCQRCGQGVGRGYEED